MSDPETVLDFWFDPARRPSWFVKDPAFDAAVAAALGELHHRAAVGELEHWQATARGTLALVILLDQVPRNIHRGTARAFATDAAALAVAEQAVERGLDTELDGDGRLFLYLPFEHAEDLAAQDRSVALFEALGEPELLDYAVRHREIIARFGRFPHRNAALGRATTAEEAAFLEQPGSSF